MKDNWGDEIEDHAPGDCPTCHGSGFYKTPFGCAGAECEDEANCECDCHVSELQ